MSAGNLRYWDAMKQPPGEALKKITGGRMNGKTNISPQWRFKIMTERFGPIGIGWKYEIVKFWTENGEGVEIMAFAQINLFFKDGEEWSAPIPGVGGSMLVAKESKGPFNSDEAFKMALTDALSVAMKSLGVAADIYMGNWDGAKYIYSEAAEYLTFSDASAYPHLIVGIEGCNTLEELKEYFTTEIKSLGTDNIGRAVLVKLKENKKQELTK